MIIIEKQKNNFRNHKATFTDYGNIKILDFKNPESSDYRIRFLFEEDYCRLHISGDLGELIAFNYSNMTYDKFSDFVNNVGYFNEKVECHNRDIFTYDQDDAKEDLIKLFEEYDCLDSVLLEAPSWLDTDEEKIDEVISDILIDFSEKYGIGSKGFDELAKHIYEPWEIVSDIGKRSTGILDLYLLAFKLAQEQLKSSSEKTCDTCIENNPAVCIYECSNHTKWKGCPNDHNCCPTGCELYGEDCYFGRVKNKEFQG